MRKKSLTASTFNGQSTGEEIANSVSHGIGALLSIAGTVIAIVTACFYGDSLSIVSAALYGSSLIIMYLFSTLYHSLTNYRAKSVFQIFDHCSIFLLIIGTYIPICLSYLRGALGWTLFGILMGVGVLGIVFNSIDLSRWKKLSMFLYIIMGWIVVIAAKPMIDKTSFNGLMFLLLGGISYMFGVIFYKAKKYSYMHFVWHLFVLGGSVLHFFFIIFYALPIK